MSSNNSARKLIDDVDEDAFEKLLADDEQRVRIVDVTGAEKDDTGDEKDDTGDGDEKDDIGDGDEKDDTWRWR